MFDISDVDICTRLWPIEKFCFFFFLINAIRKPAQVIKVFSLNIYRNRSATAATATMNWLCRGSCSTLSPAILDDPNERLNKIQRRKNYFSNKNKVTLVAYMASLCMA